MARRWLALAALCGLAALPLASAPAQTERLYCDAVGGYYPYVTRCPGGWHRFPGYSVVVPVPGVVYPPGAYVPGAYPPGAYPPPVTPPGGYPAGDPSYPPPPPGAGVPPPAQPGARANLPPPARERTEEEHAANLESAAETGMRREQDAADGYRETTLANAASKFRSIGGGFILSGYYSLAENHALLSDKAEVESQIFVVPEKLSKAGRAPSDLPDAEWALVAPMIPPARRGGRRREVSVREVLNAIFYVLSTGCQWAALPKDLVPKSTAHLYFMLWEWDGTLERLHHALYVATREREGKAASPTAAIIDSQSAKAAQKGAPRSTRRASMRARRSRAANGIFLSIRSASC